MYFENKSKTDNIKFYHHNVDHYLKKVYVFNKIIVNFKCYFSDELIAQTIPTGFELTTCGLQNQSTNHCMNRNGTISTKRLLSFIANTSLKNVACKLGTHSFELTGASADNLLFIVRN